MAAAGQSTGLESLLTPAAIVERTVNVGDDHGVTAGGLARNLDP